MLLWQSLSNFRQIPRNAIMCSTLLRAAPAVLPSKLKLASDLVTRRVEIWFLTDDDGILDGGVEPWVSCFFFFFCQKHKKRAEFREQTDLLFFLFLIQGAQCSGFHHFWRCGFLRGGHGKGSETWHHRIQCVSLDVFSWEGKAGKAIASMPRWGSHGFLWTWKQVADFNEIVEQGPRGRTWQEETHKVVKSIKPRNPTDPCFEWSFRPCFGGLTFKNGRGHLGSRKLLQNQGLRLWDFVDVSFPSNTLTVFLTTFCFGVSFVQRRWKMLMKFGTINNKTSRSPSVSISLIKSSVATIQNAPEMNWNSC